VLVFLFTRGKSVYDDGKPGLHPEFMQQCHAMVSVSCNTRADISYCVLLHATYYRLRLALDE
jgi:hypothetical protein